MAEAQPATSTGLRIRSPKLYAPGGGTLSAEIRYRRTREAGANVARALPAAGLIAETRY
jgi:hypothetical protein